MHAEDILEGLPQDKFIGYLEEASSDAPASPPEPVTPPAPATVAATAVSSTEVIPAPSRVSVEDGIPPPLESILGAGDLEVVASRALTSKTWAFYSSAATDLVTHGKNKELVRRVMIRPRVLRDVSVVDIKTSILGFDTEAPFFISPAAMAKLVHPDGEVALSRGASNEGIIQCVRPPPIPVYLPPLTASDLE